MKRRILCVLAALALCLGLAPGTARAAEAEAEVSGPLDFTSASSGTSGSGYSWNADTRTLTLNNFTQTIPDSTDRGTAILLPENAALVLEGESTIANSSYGGAGFR